MRRSSAIFALHRLWAWKAAAALACLSILSFAATPAAEGPLQWDWEYDNAGRMVRQRDPAGRLVDYDFGPNGLAAVRAPGVVFRYEYDQAGRLASVKHPAGTTRYTHDALGYVSGIQYEGVPEIKQEFNTRGFLCRATIAEWSVEYQYDVMDRLVAVTSPLGTVAWKYHLLNEVGGKMNPQVVRTLPSGLQTTWTYDADGFLKSLVHAHGDHVLANWEYHCDARGRVLECRDGAAGRATRYTYDDLGQLRQVAVDQKPAETYEYNTTDDVTRALRGTSETKLTYDKYGRLGSLNGSRVNTNVCGQVIRMLSANREMGLEYDSLGRLTGATVDDRHVAYSWDERGRMLARAAGAEVKRFAYLQVGAGDHCFAVYGDKGQVETLLLPVPQPLACRDAAGKVTYLLEDHLGNVRLVVDDHDTVLARLSYDAFGLPLAGDAGPRRLAAGFGFTGAWTDSDTGLVCLAQRWYDPVTMRFVSPNPQIGTIGEPVTLNRFAYAVNNPTSMTELDGVSARLETRVVAPSYTPGRLVDFIHRNQRP
jgi:RHS repeat-associated protein